MVVMEACDCNALLLPNDDHSTWGYTSLNPTSCIRLVQLLDCSIQIIIAHSSTARESFAL